MDTFYWYDSLNLSNGREALNIYLPFLTYIPCLHRSVLGRLASTLRNSKITSFGA